MSEELKPCPMCGGGAAFKEDGEGGHYIECQNKLCAITTNLRYACGEDPKPLLAEVWNRRAQPEPQAFPPITEQQSQWGRLYTAANALVAKMGYHGSMQADSIEMESLKDKLHDLDGGEWMPGLMPPAQPAPGEGHQAMWPQMIAALAAIDSALGLPEDGCNSLAQTLAAIRALKAQPEPAASADPLAGMSEMNRTIAYSAASKLREIGYEWTGKEWAAPSVAPEQVAWEGGEGWESLAWELCADENGEDACNELIWEGGPIPEPWGDRWMKYEGEAKRLIALVHKHAAHPPRAPLTREDFDRMWGALYGQHIEERDKVAAFARAVIAADRGISAAAIGA